MSRPPHDIRISTKRKSPWRCLWRFMWLGVLALVATPFVMLAALSEDQPRVLASAPPSGADAAKARRLAARLRRDIGAPRQRSSITITERDANTMMALVRRGLGTFSGQVNIGASRAMASATVHVPQNPFGKFINFQLSVMPSDNGLSLGEFQVGSLSIPGQWMAEVARWGLNLAAENDLGDRLLGAIHAVRPRTGSLKVDYGPVRNLLV